MAINSKNIHGKIGLPTALMKNRNFKRRYKDDVGQEESGVKYRNRALERSQMKDEYYIKIDEEYQLLKKQTVEESRYMGGDEDHTHMVKGLDYTLLQKVRSNMDKRDISDAISTEDIDNVRDGAIGHTDLGFSIYKKFFYHTHPQHKHFKEKMDKTYQLLLEGHKFKKTYYNRSEYIYNLNIEPDDSDIPSMMTVYNDEAQTVYNDKLLNIYRNKNVKIELLQVLNWHQENKKRKREDRLAYRPQSITIVDDDGDEDIFENAGEYKSDEYNVEVVNKLKDNETYFNDVGEKDDEQATVEIAKLKRSIVTMKPKQPINDGYNECYPEFGGFDSDEETNIKTKKKRSSKSDWNKIEKIIAEKKERGELKN